MANLRQHGNHAAARPAARGDGARGGGARRVAAGAGDVPAVLVLVGAGVLAAGWLMPFATAAPVALSLAVYGGVAALVAATYRAAHPGARFGLANAVTLLRAGGVAVFAGLAAEPSVLMRPDGALSWWALGAALALLCLDGIDGWLARRRGTASAFGARFDMEVDSLFILVLAVLAATAGEVGVWVVGLGLMRYGFMLAGRLLPALTRPLPESLRRKTVCVVQVAALAALLAPPVAPPVSSAVAAAAFAALLWSFALDVRWLLRAGR